MRSISSTRARSFPFLLGGGASATLLLLGPLALPVSLGFDSGAGLGARSRGAAERGRVFFWDEDSFGAEGEGAGRGWDERGGSWRDGPAREVDEQEEDEVAARDLES